MNIDHKELASKRRIEQPEAPAFCWATELAMTQQPVTLSVTEAREVSAEMQRLHSENETLQQGYAAARLEIESLQARLKTMAEEHADELTVAHLDGRMRAAQPAGAANTRAQENVALLAEILNRRPAMNAGLTQAYAAWTAEVYDLMGAIAAEPANEDRAQAAPESFLEIPDVQDESGINSHYSRELVLECINAALASHGQAQKGKK